MAAAGRRILHVVGRLDRGGIETSLLQLLRAVDRQRYRMDFMVLRPEPGALDDEVRALGSRIIPCPATRRPLRFARDFARILDRHGPYDVVQSHVHFFGGHVLRLAARHGVPMRIAHSRNDTRAAEAGRSWPRRAYVRLMRHWIRRHATCRIAVSRSAALDLFGPGAADEVEIVRSGRDFGAYAEPVDRVALRAELGLPPESFVLGHVGRFYWRKNHPFVIAIAAELLAREPRARLLLVGDGPEQGAIEALVRARGLAGRTVFAGARSDVPRLLKGAMDAFVLPSHHEGLSMAVVEAQAAGLPCVLSEALTEEGDLVPGLIHRLPLSAPPALWAERLLAAARAPRPAPEEALPVVVSSEFGIDTSAARLARIYAADLP